MSVASIRRILRHVNAPPEEVRAGAWDGRKAIRACSRAERGTIPGRLHGSHRRNRNELQRVGLDPLSWLLHRYSENDQRYDVLMRFSAALRSPFHASCLRAMKPGQVQRGPGCDDIAKAGLQAALNDPALSSLADSYPATLPAGAGDTLTIYGAHRRIIRYDPGSPDLPPVVQRLIAEVTGLRKRF